MENNRNFSYEYSAGKQEEINRIREKYLPKNENDMDRLRMLDKKASKPGMIAALAVGIISSLILGVGMCCAMVWGSSLFIPGIFIGIIGIIGISLSYPLDIMITKKQREKLASEILRLTEKLTK